MILIPIFDYSLNQKEDYESYNPTILQSYNPTILQSYKIILFFLIATIFNCSIFAQTLVNKSWAEVVGSPSIEIDWSASITDQFGNIYTTGNNLLNTSNTNLFVNKYNRQGVLIWEEEFSLSPNSNNYGIDIIIGNNNNIYVLGTSIEPASGNYDFVLLKYSSTGILQWNSSFNSVGNKNDIPVAFINDPFGNIFITGISYVDPNLLDSDFQTIKIDSNGDVQWSNTYDYNNLYEAPIGIDLNTDGDIVVSGTSASTSTTWEYTTLKYDKADGIELQEIRVDNGGIGIDIPSSFTQDIFGNYLITGSGNGINGVDVKTIKLDPNLNLIWEKTYDGHGFEDKGLDIDTDSLGNIFICGYTTTQEGFQHGVVLKYDVNGNVIWEKEKYNYKTPEITTIAKHLVADLNGNLFVSGENIAQDNSYITTTKYNPNGGFIWEEKYDYHPLTSDKVLGIEIDSIGSIYVKSVSYEDEKPYYINIQYNEWKRPNDVIYNDDGRAESKANELIIRFNPEDMIISNVENLDIVFNSADYFLNPNTISAIDNKLPFDFTIVRAGFAPLQFGKK